MEKEGLERTSLTICVGGESGAGKSTFCSMYLKYLRESSEGELNLQQEVFGLNMNGMRYKCGVNFGSKRLKLEIRDINLPYGNIADFGYRGADVIIILYDCSQDDGEEKVMKDFVSIVHELSYNCGYDTPEDFPVLTLGNKFDLLPRKVHEKRNQLLCVDLTRRVQNAFTVAIKYALAFKYRAVEKPKFQCILV